MASQTVVHVTNANFQAEVINSELPVLVDFWAQWCGPCKMLGPVLDQLATDYAGKVKIAKIDIDADEATKTLAINQGVQSIPALKVFKAGKMVDETIGAQSKAKLAAMLDRALA